MSDWAKKRRWCAPAALGIGIVAAQGIVNAATTANLTVTATVIASCDVGGGTLAFGDYDPTAAGNVDQTTTYDVTCTRGSVPVLALDFGANSSGGTNRRMRIGATTEFLTYQLYKDAARSEVWGSTGTDQLTLSAAPSNDPRTVTVYGRILPAQDAAQGSYTDSVLITVTF